MAQIQELGSQSYLWALGLLLVAGFGATAPWRFVGVILAKRLTIESEALVWVRAVSTALIAGLVARMVLLPSGALADVALPLRLAAFALAVLVYFLSRRSLAAGVLAGAVGLIAEHLLLGS